MFNLAIDSKLGGRHVVSITVEAVAPNIASPATYVPSSSCWVTAKSSALFGISASRWTMLWPSPR